MSAAGDACGLDPVGQRQRVDQIPVAAEPLTIWNERKDGLGGSPNGRESVEVDRQACRLAARHGVDAAFQLTAELGGDSESDGFGGVALRGVEPLESRADGDAEMRLERLHFRLSVEFRLTSAVCRTPRKPGGRPDNLCGGTGSYPAFVG